MNEADLQRTIIEAAQWSGWLIHHDRPSQNAAGRWSTAIEGTPGFPDLVLVHPRAGRTIYMELKSDTGKVTPMQQAWLDGLQASGQDARLVLPPDLDSVIHELTHPKMHQALCPECQEYALCDADCPNPLGRLQEGPPR